MRNRLNRRRFLATGTLALAAARPALSAPLDAGALGLEPDSGADQSATLQGALETARAARRDLFLPAGEYRVSNVNLPSGTGLTGLPGRTTLQLAAGDTVLAARAASGLRLSGLHLRGNGGNGGNSGGDGWTGLMSFDGCDDLRISDCRLSAGAGQGIFLQASAGRITGCTLHALGGAAISAQDSTGLWITGNSISDCGNLGIYVARAEPGHDGTIIAQNRISRIDWKAGGNGENGNGINVFLADAVVVSDNVISDCAFSAVRLNTTRNCLVRGNVCTRSSEVAIFSEFGFSGSVISDNIIDGAAQGISITNFDDGGRLATCSGNIVRNIWPESPTNPDTVPVGIAAEADTLLSGNLVENVPGTGLALGWGPFLRDLNATGNILRGCDIAIGVSLVEGTGPAVVTANLIRPAKGGLAIAGMRWNEVVEPDLIARADAYPTLTITSNRVN